VFLQTHIGCEQAHRVGRQNARKAWKSVAYAQDGAREARRHVHVVDERAGVLEAAEAHAEGQKSDDERLLSATTVARGQQKHGLW